MATIKSIRKNFRKMFVKPWVREPSKIRQAQALKEMTGNFNLQKKPNKTLCFWTGEDTKNKVRNKWPIGKTFATHMKGKVLQFLLYKKACTNCEKKKKMPWLVWLSGLSTGLWTKRWPVQFPVRARAWVVGQFLSWGHVWGNQSMFFSHINISFPLFLPPFPSL